MKALIKRPGEDYEEIDIENDLKSLQEAVGGYIQAVPVDEYTAVICDEEGRLKGLPDNCMFRGISFVGTILIVGTDGEEFTDVSWRGYHDRI